MKRTRSFLLGGENHNITSAKNHIKEIKKRTAINALLNEKDYTFMVDVFKNHPGFLSKTKNQSIAGIRHCGYSKASGFNFVLSDGHEEDFGIEKCFLTPERYQEYITIEAYRNTIHSQIIEAKEHKGFGIIQCDLCNTFIENRNWDQSRLDNEEYEAAQVDHNQTNQGKFSDILKDFMNQTLEAKTPLLCKEVCNYNTGNTEQWTLSEGIVREEWIAFHKRRAVFRFLCPKCNQKER
jgi:hypothetical protein